MKVTILPYDPAWATEFQEAKSALEVILASVPYVSIEHVGSTSVPGLYAKPVIDVDIIIQPSSLAAARAALVRAGYTDCGEMDVPGRYAFRQPGYGKHQPAHGESTADGRPRRNTYLMIEGCRALRSHLDVRRVLMEDKELRGEYGAVKEGLVGKEFSKIGDYVREKDWVLAKILARAGWSEEEIKG